VKVIHQNTDTLFYLVIFEIDVLWQALAALLHSLHCGYLHLFLLQICIVHSDPVPFLPFFCRDVSRCRLTSVLYVTRAGSVCVVMLLTPCLVTPHLSFSNSFLTSQLIGVLWKVFGKSSTDYSRRQSIGQ